MVQVFSLFRLRCFREALLCYAREHSLTLQGEVSLLKQLDLLFDWFGFNHACKSLFNSTQAKQLNLNQSNRSSSCTNSDFSPYKVSDCFLAMLKFVSDIGSRHFVTLLCQCDQSWRFFALWATF